MPKKIEVTVAGQIVTPRNISVGNVTEDSGAVLCISFDGTWSGYYKSVVFYDKRKKKPIKYEFADSGSHVEVVLPEAVTIEYGKHPFAVVGSNADGMTKITALGYIIVDNTLFPGLNQSSVDEVRSDDAYSSFVKAYDDVSQSIDDAYAITGDALVVAEEINEKVKEIGVIASGVEGSKESAEQSAKEAKEFAESIASLEATVIKDDGKEYVINLSNGTNIDITTPNLKGADGKNGIDGKDGVDGKNGIDGVDGTAGKDGIDGKDGSDGRSVYVLDEVYMASVDSEGGYYITLDRNEYELIDGDILILPGDGWAVYRAYGGSEYAGDYWQYSLELKGKISSETSTTPLTVLTPSGTMGTFTATLDDYTEYKVGDTFIIVPQVNAPNSAPPSLNINGLGAKEIMRVLADGSQGGLRTSGFIRQGVPLLVTYSGTAWVVNERQPFGGADFHSNISVAKGGTGKGSWVADGLIYASSSSALSQVEQPASEPSVLTQDVSGKPYWTALSELGGGSGGGGEKRVWRIGYTEDCDYVVTSQSSAVSLFQTAVDAMNDGDILLVMPGMYGGSTRLNISKNISIVGIGMPQIYFQQYISGESEFDDVNMSLNNVKVYNVNYDGLLMTSSLTVYANDPYYDVGAGSTVCVSNCRISIGASRAFRASGKFINSLIDVEGPINCGSYFSTSLNFVKCSIECTNMPDLQYTPCYAYDCDIHLTGGDGSSPLINSTNVNLERCNITIDKTGINASDLNGWYVYDCRFYGNKPSNNVYANGSTYFYAGEAYNS